MGSTDTLSDCSESSRISECLSTASGLSIYQNEYLQLKQNIGSNLSNGDITIKRPISTGYENRIQNSSNQVQKLTIENEKLRNTIYNLEERKELYNIDKIEQLLITNNLLEANLEAANKQIQRLIDIQNAKTKITDNQIIKSKILYLEQCNNDLNKKNIDISNQINEIKFEKNQLLTEHNNLKSEVNELQVEFNSRVNCISKLKLKISEQYIQLTETLEKNAQLTQELEKISNEMQCVKKMENWYKEELHKSQREKVILFEESTISRNNSVFFKGAMENLNLELANWKRKYDQLTVLSSKEKYTLIKQIEVMHSGMPSGEKLQITNTSFEIEPIAKSYQSTISDLTADVMKIRSDYAVQQKNIEELNKQKAELLSKYLLIENDLKERGKLIENLENIKNDLKTQLESSVFKEKELKAQLINTENIKSKLNIELSTICEEKKIVEDSVRIVKDQFLMLKNNISALHQKLKSKNKEILQLQLEKEVLSKKMDWETCALQESKRNETKLLKFNEKMSFLTQTLEQKEKEIDNLIREKLELHERNEELNKHFVSNNNKVTLSCQNQTNKLFETLNINRKEYSSIVSEDYENVICILHHICEICRTSEKANMSLHEYSLLTCNEKIEYIKKMINFINNNFKILSTKILQMEMI